MRIGIDARSVGSHGGGDETYVSNLIDSMARFDSVNDYVPFVGSKAAAALISVGPHMRPAVLHPKALQVRIPISLPIAAVAKHLDLLHVQYLAPPFCPVPFVVTIHDIAFEHFPQFFTPLAAAQLRIMVPLAAKRAKAVLTLSEFCKRDIMARYRIPDDRVIVVPAGVDGRFKPAFSGDVDHSPGDQAANPFILTVGNLQPRKNLKTLIAAYIELRRADTVSHRLVIVGRKAWLHDDIFAAARASGYADDIVFTGYVTDDALVKLYQTADVFVYPSIFEGFGLPPLEAMACGTPVITSNTSGMPETTGDAAELIDPFNVLGLADAIASVLSNHVLAETMRHKGLAQATKFSWERTAQQVLRVYEQTSSPF